MKRRNAAAVLKPEAKAPRQSGAPEGPSLGSLAASKERASHRAAARADAPRRGTLSISDGSSSRIVRSGPQRAALAPPAANTAELNILTAPPLATGAPTAPRAPAMCAVPPPKSRGAKLLNTTNPQAVAGLLAGRRVSPSPLTQLAPGALGLSMGVVAQGAGTPPVASGTTPRTSTAAASKLAPRRTRPVSAAAPPRPDEEMPPLPAHLFQPPPPRPPPPPARASATVRVRSGLPASYRRLLESFISFETTLMFFSSRGEPALFAALQRSMEQVVARWQCPNLARP